MKQIEQLKILAENTRGLLTTNQVTNAGLPRHVLKTAIDSGFLTKLERGIYLLNGYWEDEYMVYSLKYSKGVFSHDTALFLHGLTDTTPSRHCMTFTAGYNTKSLSNPFLDVHRSSKELFFLGISEVATPSGNQVSCYSIERTLCDILRGSEANDTDRARKAYQRYCLSPEKDISLLLEFATRLHVATTSQSYLRALL